MPAKPLTAEQQQDAARLKAAFSKFKARRKEEGLPHTQLALEEELGLKQSAMSQYLNGDIPLNAVALGKFCRLMGEKPEEISPSIYESELERSKALAIEGVAKEADVSKTTGASAPISDDVLAALASASPDIRKQVEMTVRMMLGMPQSRKQRAA